MSPRLPAGWWPGWSPRWSPRWSARWSAVLVTGDSMLPWLRPGDCLLVQRGRPVRAGDVVVGRLRDRPGLLVVKRAVAPAGTGWLLASDNASAPGAVGGPGEVVAVVRWRYWPLPPARR